MYVLKNVISLNGGADGEGQNGLYFYFMLLCTVISSKTSLFHGDYVRV